jgi:2-oxoglutarate ferredoxin oxidoreductase subunit alpha
VVQAEDELSAINMVIGAGWAGSRAMTATSGPGLSLMAEAAGLSYFAEIPAVIWDVQRAGPSTGLPTRTLQGDLRAATHLSHGDTEHIVLLPANPEECYEFAQLALDLAEKYQTLVIVLSDLDIGMNFSVTNELQLPTGEYNRGKVLDAEDLNQVNEFARYRDIDNDGVPQRTLPGTLHTKAAYFTRGTGHNEKAGYTEDPLVFKNLLLRLKKKFEHLSADLPKPLIQTDPSAKIALVSYGSTEAVIPELQSRLKNKNVATSAARVRALPLKKQSPSELESFFNSHDRILILEQNRDAQLHDILVKEFPHLATRFQSVLSFDGWPISIDEVEAQVSQQITAQVKDQVKTC